MTRGEDGFLLYNQKGGENANLGVSKSDPLILSTLDGSALSTYGGGSGTYKPESFTDL